MKSKTRPRVATPQPKSLPMSLTMLPGITKLEIPKRIRSHFGKLLRQMASDPATTVGSMIEPAPPKIGKEKTIAPMRMNKMDLLDQPLRTAKKTMECTVKKSVKAITINIEPLHENSGSVEIQCIHNLAIIPIKNPASAPSGIVNLGFRFCNFESIFRKKLAKIFNWFPPI